MILSIFLLVIGIAMALVIVGIFLEDYAVQLVGLSFLFISGAIFSGIPILDGSGGTIQYKSGETTLTNYSYYSDNITINYTSEITIDDYSTYSNGVSHFVGIFLMVLSMLASAVIFTRLKDEDEGGID